MKNCSICKSELINEKIHFRDEFITISEAWCPSCEIYLTRKVQGKKTGAWKTSTVQQKDVGSEISNEMLEILKRNIENLDINDDNFSLVKKLWDKFIIMKKDSDRIFSYQNSIEKGCVIIRENKRIGKFPDILNMLEQQVTTVARNS